VIKGALRAEAPDLLTVILPQSLQRQPQESQELLSQVCILLLLLCQQHSVKCRSAARGQWAVVDVIHAQSSTTVAVLQQQLYMSHVQRYFLQDLTGHCMQGSLIACCILVCVNFMQHLRTAGPSPAGIQP
jgi:hypothetical protein